MASTGPSAVLRHLASLTVRGRTLIESRGELGRLIVAHPELAELEFRLIQARAVLAETRHRYVSTISTDAMALSLETAALLKVLAETVHVGCAADLGSGYSSFVLRDSLPTGSSCRSVDDSEHWLSQTGAYLIEMGLGSENLVTWAEFSATHEKYDLVFHDLGSTHSLRQDALPVVMDSVAKGGWLILDDVHNTRYRKAVKAAISTDFELFRLAWETMDTHGRYAWLARRR